MGVWAKLGMPLSRDIPKKHRVDSVIFKASSMLASRITYIYSSKELRVLDV